MVNILDMTARGLSIESVMEEAYNCSANFAKNEPVLCNIHGPYTLHFNCYDCQQRFKELGYRIFEELCEAATACSAEHEQEEIADAVLFTNWLYRLAKFNLHIQYGPLNSVVSYCNYHDAFIALGTMTNCLKLRPWRRQYSEVDNLTLSAASAQFVWKLNSIIALRFRGGIQELIDIIDKKVQVNNFRIYSNY